MVVVNDLHARKTKCAMSLSLDQCSISPVQTSRLINIYKARGRVLASPLVGVTKSNLQTYMVNR